ncbi:DegT/DnrJ/EryC1/StrS family aminotransferase [Streptomyces sp. TRM66268-LWL]|uniref:DegT/DnrJ/EryC1/StrS family aminotransferase n=1 Tax=Streptomyces polyasparticus TaxID=2767826 RepID=A0ABR7SU04_9ACTN|nr:DegT/DnrJ/EryC1/StrS family aminotransferase [Streptomyces polyasparticus]MBC9718269.1 DegT/DnrJ/EryC1/StrS family aminotransferase [Streptomyces polyasparticus]
MGTVAMLKAAGIGLGDEVIVPAYGNVEIAEAVVSAGGLPVFADIDPGTYCLDAAAVTAAIGPRTAAIVAVRRFGESAGLQQVHEVGTGKGLLVLQEVDTADPSGAAEGDGPVAVGRRRAQAAYLSARLRGVDAPVHSAGHTYRQYVVRVPGNGRPDRDAFARAVRARGVRCSVPVKTPVHRLPEYRRDVELPRTERAADETLALQIGAELGRRELQRIVSSCNALGGLLVPAF